MENTLCLPESLNIVGLNHIIWGASTGFSGVLQYRNFGYLQMFVFFILFWNTHQQLGDFGLELRPSEFHQQRPVWCRIRRLIVRPMDDLKIGSSTHRTLGKWNSRYVLIAVIDGWGISCEITLRLMPLDLTDDTSTLDHVMAWCRQTSSPYLSQCWPRSISSYSVTRPQCVELSHVFDQSDLTTINTNRTASKLRDILQDVSSSWNSPSVSVLIFFGVTITQSTRTDTVGVNCDWLLIVEAWTKFNYDTCKDIFVNEKAWMLLAVSLKFVSEGHIDNKTTLVHVTGRRQTSYETLPKNNCYITIWRNYAPLG